MKISSGAVKGFLEECRHFGFNEQQSAYLLERSLDTSDALMEKDAEDDSTYVSTTKAEFFKRHPQAYDVYRTPKYRKDPKYAAFFAALDGKSGSDAIKVNKDNPYDFKFNIPGQNS